MKPLNEHRLEVIYNGAGHCSLRSNAPGTEVSYTEATYAPDSWHEEFDQYILRDEDGRIYRPMPYIKLVETSLADDGIYPFRCKLCGETFLDDHSSFSRRNLHIECEHGLKAKDLQRIEEVFDTVDEVAFLQTYHPAPQQDVNLEELA